jgi:hypothetical protein
MQPSSDGTGSPVCVDQRPCPSARIFTLLGLLLKSVRLSSLTFQFESHVISYCRRNGMRLLTPTMMLSARISPSCCSRRRCSRPGSLHGVHIMLRSITEPFSCRGARQANAPENEREEKPVTLSSVDRRLRTRHLQRHVFQPIALSTHQTRKDEPVISVILSASEGSSSRTPQILRWRSG